MKRRTKDPITEARTLLAGKRTPARATKLRALNAELCGCLLCRWALNPPLTFAEHAARMEITERHNQAETWNDLHKSWAFLLGSSTHGKAA